MILKPDNKLLRKNTILVKILMGQYFKTKAYTQALRRGQNIAQLLKSQI